MKMNLSIFSHGWQTTKRLLPTWANSASVRKVIFLSHLATNNWLSCSKEGKMRKRKVKTAYLLCSLVLSLLSYKNLRGKLRPKNKGRKSKRITTATWNNIWYVDCDIHCHFIGLDWQDYSVKLFIPALWETMLVYWKKNGILVPILPLTHWSKAENFISLVLDYLL